MIVRSGISRPRELKEGIPFPDSLTLGMSDTREIISVLNILYLNLLLHIYMVDFLSIFNLVEF